MPKLMVTGSREGRYDVEYWLDQWVSKHGEPDLVVLGDATGVDAQASLWCEKHQYKHVVVDADWDAYGPRAGPLRNLAMVALCGPGDYCLAFPVGVSKGTRHAAGAARKSGLLTFILPLSKVAGRAYQAPGSGRRTAVRGPSYF